MKKIELHLIENMNSQEQGKILVELLKQLRLEVYRDKNEWDDDFYVAPRVNLDNDY